MYKWLILVLIIVASIFANIVMQIMIKKVNSNYKLHNVNSSLLIGKLTKNDEVKERLK